jgi:hypothetical protein
MTGNDPRQQNHDDEQLAVARKSNHDCRRYDNLKNEVTAEDVVDGLRNMARRAGEPTTRILSADYRNPSVRDHSLKMKKNEEAGAD